ncbi:helix-turn-helix transcriptional regulator [Streptomyces aidingensis]|uniref:Regulatory protein, luxR family n=1 Tax=Streptomyces aidingensis TaxID=910347 RepID=A0A1I1RCB7_9ACTN|nr:helix-turn-helix transcriptional regulator [Streptomyces aidingensis]SFD32001.1 regulatory protein, luxR family [Streptomyces aidingensis]
MNHPSGLPAATVAVYRLRVAHPTDSAEQLAERLELTPGEVAEAEAELGGLGLLRRSPAGGWVAVSPENAAEELLTAAEQDILRRQIAMAATRARLHALSGHYLEARSMRSAKGDIETVRGVENIRALIDDLGRTCTVTVESMQATGGFTEAAIRAALPLDLDRLAGGVSMRMLVQDAVRRHWPSTQYVTKICEAGARVRSVGVLPSKMLIFDGSCALLPLDPVRPEVGAVAVREPAVLGFLRGLFDHIWNQAKDFHTAEEDSGPAPTGVEREVLLLIAAGLSNQDIAGQLGMSPRTVNRVVADLMERLGAESRFQAGVKAAQHGWLS